MVQLSGIAETSLPARKIDMIRLCITGREYWPPVPDRIRVQYPPCPGGEIGRRKGLKRLSTQFGNGWREWSQIRGNLRPRVKTMGNGNPELSLVCGGAAVRESVET